MHMSDALLSPAVGAGFLLASGGVLAWASREVGRQADTRLGPTMGVLGACVFAAQLLNFAIPGTGSSGHLAGGMLLAAVLGPASGFVVMASVLIVQCLLFGDGGLLALGTNLFNLGFYPCFVGYPLYHLVARRLPDPLGRSLGLGLGALASVELGALSVAIQTTASGATPLPFAPFAGLMTAIHLPVGLAEAVVTAAAAGLLFRLRPAVADGVERTASRTWRRAVTAAGLAAAAAAGLASWLASQRPDGLEWSLARAGDAKDNESSAAESGPVASVETSAAGMGGAAAVLGLSLAVGGAGLARRRRQQARPRATD